jgi:ABC-type multidrug transport system fused ATPase/permease subunit
MWNGSSFQRLYSLMRPEVRPQLGRLVGVMVLAALVAFGEKAPLLLLQPLFDRVLFPAAGRAAAESGEPGFLDGLFGSLQARVEGWIFGDPAGVASDDQKIAALWTVAGLIFLLTVLNAAAQYTLTIVSRLAALRMVVELRQRVARHLLSLSMRYHGERHFGDLLSRISSDVNSTLQSVNVILKDVTQLPFLVVGSLLVAFFTAPMPTLCVLAVMPLIAVPIGVLGKRVRKRSKKSLSSLGASVEVLTQMFTGIRTVKAFRAEERELARYGAVNDHYLALAMRTVRAIASIEAWTAFLSTLGLGLLIAVIVLINKDRKFFNDSGEMGAFLLSIALIYGHVKRLTNAIGKVQESAGAADRLQGLLDEPPDIVERRGAHALESLGRGVRFEGVTFTYPGTDKSALQGVDLELRTGETLALVGASGAGKTTLVDLVARFIEPSSGRITVDGHDLRELTLDSWTKQYAMVGQVPFLFHTSILENIRYGKPDATPAEVEAAARAANIHEFIQGLPEKYETAVGDAGARLSGGQRQRLTIARAILKGAPLLLLDEATSALDSESEAVVQEALDRLVVGRTVVVIAHRLSTIRNADRIAVLEAGRVVELGTHDELLTLGGAYARLHAMQFREPAGA